MDNEANEFEMRLNEIIYDLSTMKENNSDAQDIFNKIAEAHHELFDVVVRILCDGDSSLVYKRLVIRLMADPIVKGINARLAHPELFYASESDDVIDIK